MSTQRQYFINEIKILIVFISFLTLSKTTEYKLKLISLEKCKLPDSKWMKNAPLEYNMAASKVNRTTTLINANFSIFERAGPVYVTLRGYQVRQTSSKDLIFNLEKIPCTSPLVMTLLKVIKLELAKDCFSIPGNYSSEKINIEDFAPILTKAMIGPGKYSYDLEFLTDKGVAACIDITCDISAKR